MKQQQTILDLLQGIVKQLSSRSESKIIKITDEEIGKITSIMTSKSLDQSIETKSYQDYINVLNQQKLKIS